MNREIGENGLTIEEELQKYKRYLRDRDLEIKELKQVLSTPKITSEQVKEDIERIRDDFEFYSLSVNNSLMLNMSKKGLQSLNNITQYISQLEGQNRQLRKGYEYMLELNLEFNSQLDAVREVCNKDFVSCGYGDLQNIIKQILEGGTK